MVTAKTTTLTFRIEPGLKEALRAAAVREHRSIANTTAMDGGSAGNAGAVAVEAPAGKRGRKA